MFNYICFSAFAMPNIPKAKALFVSKYQNYNFIYYGFNKKNFYFPSKKVYFRLKCEYPNNAVTHFSIHFCCC